MRLSSVIVLAGVFALASPRAQTLTTTGGESKLKVVLSTPYKSSAVIASSWTRPFGTVPRRAPAGTGLSW
jgi:hypothetical protein